MIADLQTQPTLLPQEVKSDTMPENKLYTQNDLAAFEAAVSLPPLLTGRRAATDSAATAVKWGRGQQLAATKVAISIRLSPRVIAHFKREGRGWQRRIDQVLCYFVTIDERRGKSLQPWPRQAQRAAQLRSALPAAQRVPRRSRVSL